LPAILYQHGIAQPDIHVRVTQQNISFDEQFLRQSSAQASVEKFRALTQKIVTDANGIEGNVRRHNLSGTPGSVQQYLTAFQLQGFGPGIDTARVARFMGSHDGALERLECEPQDGGAGVLLAPQLGGSRVNAVRAPRIEHAPVLYHTAFGKHHNFAPPQDLFGEEGQQAG
jgi:hypothetical protein